MNITKAQYATDLDGNVNSVRATINGEVWVVPLDPDNTHYSEILKQVKEGKLTIKEAK